MKTIFKSLLLITLLSLPVYADKMAKYELTFTNITKGQPLTPAAIIIHDGSYKLFELGSASGPGLYKLAEDGMTAELESEVLAQGARFLQLDGLILPGQSSSIVFEAHPRSFVSIASMLAKTNDGFASSLRPLSLHKRYGHSHKKILSTFDAGSELNNELESYIPAFGNVGVRTDSGEGFVSFHPGLQGVGDLDLQGISFAPQSAIVEIKRVK